MGDERNGFLFFTSHEMARGYTPVDAVAMSESDAQTRGVPARLPASATGRVFVILMWIEPR
jgi:hypothetical protein